MKNLSLILIVLCLWSSATYACRVSPWVNVRNNFDSFKEKADVVFLGKLNNIEKLNSVSENVHLTIIKKVKGDIVVGQNITILNRHHTSCSHRFGPIDVNYYVFAKKVNDTYLIDKYATFYPDGFKYAQ